MKNFATIYLIIAFFAVSFFFGKCSTRNERRQLETNLIVSRDSVKALSYEIEGVKYNSYQKDAIILTEKQAKEAGLIEIERLKKLRIKDVIANAKLEGTIKVLRDSLKLPNEPEYITIRDTSGVTKNYIRYPFTLLDVNEKYLKLSAGMTANKHAWFKSETPLSGEMTIGYQKAGLFKTVPVGVFTSSNPNLTINQMDIVVTEEKKRMVQRTWFKMLSGVVLFETGRILLN